MVTKLVNLIFHFCFVPSFVISSFVALMIAIVLYLTVRLINNIFYRKVLWYLIALAYAHVALVIDWWSLLELNIYMNTKDFRNYLGKENALLILNHSYDIDWIPIVSLCARLNLLGSIRGFVKKSLQYIPIIGWSFIMSDYVLLHRTYQKDERIIRDTIKSLATFPYTIWLFLYPEGTWFNERNHRTSQAYAEKMNLPQLKYHLQPRTTGFVATLKAMRGQFKALYNIEICFRENHKYDSHTAAPSIAKLLEGKQFIADVYIKRIGEDEIPVETEQQKLLLQNMFQMKDRLRESYVKTGSFFVASDVPAEGPLKIERPFYVVVVFLLCCFLTMTWILYWVIQLYQSYGLMIALCPLAVIELCTFLTMNAAVKASVIR